MAIRAWRQQWRDLLFMHWPVRTGALRPYVPEALALDEYRGTSWIGVVPFWIGAVGVHRAPPVRCRIPEVNVRTCVRYQNRPGIWFFTLDTTSLLAVVGGRSLYKLPYGRASMDVTRTIEGVRYRSRRTDGTGFELRYAPTGRIKRAPAGSLEHWLTERYTLYSATDRGALFRADIEHAPWPLQPAELEVVRNDMAMPDGSLMPDHPEHLRYAGCLDVTIKLPEMVIRAAPPRPVTRPLRPATLKG